MMSDSLNNSPGAFDNLIRWYNIFTGNDIKIWVEDPETATETKALIPTSYTSYRVLIKRTGRDVVGVRKRYSEFETARNALKTLYIPYGIFVPGLLPKKLVNNLDKEFLIERAKVIYNSIYFS